MCPCNWRFVFFYTFLSLMHKRGQEIMYEHKIGDRRCRIDGFCAAKLAHVSTHVRSIRIPNNSFCFFFLRIHCVATHFPSFQKANQVIVRSFGNSKEMKIQNASFSRACLRHYALRLPAVLRYQCHHILLYKDITGQWCVRCFTFGGWVR